MTKRVWAFEAAWARLEHEQPGWPADPVDQAFHRHLEEWLRFHRAMLVGEVVPESLRYLRTNPTAGALTAFDHVLVDEYQDLNRAEQDLVDLLAANGRTAVVGDVDQSIYRFRYANPEGIADYAARHVPTHDEILGECRRCPQTVVRMADSLILRNHPGDPGPRLAPDPAKPAGDVTIVQWPSLAAEIEGLANAIARIVLDDQVDAGEVMVLTPRRRIGYRLRNRSRELGVPVHSFYNEESLESDRAQASFNLLTLLAQPEDLVAYRWWLGLGSPSWRASEYAILRAHCEASGERPREALAGHLAGTCPITGVAGLASRERELAAELGRLGVLSLDAMIDDLFPDAIDDVLVLRESALLARPSLTTTSELHDRLKGQVTQPEMPEKGDFVRVMSLHKSKGLTSRVVVIAGAIEGLIPFHDDKVAAAEQALVLEEQRRLFYVAVTRCTETLIISSAQFIPVREAKQMGADVSRRGRTVASRFIDEFGTAAPASITGPAWGRGAPR
jgi:superfamily I DNA/RNA helicase